MKKNNPHLMITILLVLLLCTPAAAFAGLYIGLQGGAGFVPDATGSDSDGSANFTYDVGYDGSIMLGYDLGEKHPSIGKGRVELEFNTASNDLNGVEFVEGKVGADGSVERTSIMVNTIGEYTTQSGMIIYALLGLGWAKIGLDNVSILGEPYVDDSSSQLAYQAGVGIGWNLSDHFVLDIGYRYYGTTDPEFTKQDGTNLDYEYKSHRLIAGLRLHF
jgi:opacity protein-like surface antigen